jgi:hypothetical protein
LALDCLGVAVYEGLPVMPHISETRQGQLLLIGVAVLSIAPLMCQRWLSNSGIYEIRVMGGLHPGDLLFLRKIGSLAVCMPCIVVIALLASFFRPAWIRFVLAGATAVFLVYVLAFLIQAVCVITFNLSPIGH